MKRLALAHKGIWENGKLGSSIGETGYGRMGDEIENALRNLGYDIEIHAGGGQILDAAGQPAQLPAAKDTVPATVLAAQLPGHMWGWWEGQHSVNLCMFESDTVPVEYADILHEYETLVVPCEANRIAFAAHHDNIHVVPLGVNPDHWHYTPRRRVSRRDPFTFLTAGAGWHRKGFDLVIRAFLELRDELNVPMRLIVKAQNDLVWDEQPTDPDLHYVKERLTREDEVLLYGRAHCYVSGSRGEGWGLCPHQAIAQGIPTILGNGGGQAEFARFGIPIDTHMTDANYGIWQDTGQWWEPDYDHMLAMMRSVFLHYSDYEAQAKKGAADIAHLTWENTARGLIKVFSDEPPFKPTGWHTFTRKLYPIMVNRDMRCDVGGVRYVFTPGTVYYQFSDVKRVIFMSGALARECPEDGLLPDQCVAFATAKEADCPTCHRPWPSVEDEAQAVLEELAAMT